MVKWKKNKLVKKATLVDVQLNIGASNTFEVILYDEQGNKMDCQPNTFNILQGINPVKLHYLITLHWKLPTVFKTKIY